VVSVTNAQNTFVKTIGSVDSDYGTSCKLTADKGTILTISSADAFGRIQFSLVKTDHNGNPVWDKTFQISDYTYASTVLETTDGGYLVFGSTGASWNSCSLFLLATDAFGNQEWLKTFSASQNDKAVSIIPATDGFISCSIGDYNLGTYPRTIITWYDEHGEVMLARSYGTPVGTEVRGITCLADGGVAFASFSKFDMTDFFPHTLITNADKNGIVRWTKFFKTFYDDEPFCIASDQSDNIYITGRSYFVGKEWDGFFLKLDKQGTVLNNTFYNAGTSNGEIFRCIITGENGGAVIAGDLGTFDERDITLLQVNANGGQVWAKRYPFSVNYTNYPYEIYRDHTNGIVFTGDVRPPAWYRDAILVKTDQNGDISCYDQDMSYTTGPEQFVITDQLHDTMLVQTVPVVASSVLTSWNITPKLICEHPAPIPDFAVSIHDGCDHFCLDFTDKSLNQPTSWLWEFEGADTLVSTQQNPVNICFDERGSYTIKLTATNSVGFSITTYSDVAGTDCPESPLLIPNIFSPNNDGLNDEFAIKNLPAVYTLTIYTRWGNEVFAVSNSRKYWNGKDGGNKEVSDGIYYYVLSTPENSYKGFIRVSR
jgi:gliding motility-associated-like protein